MLAGIGLAIVLPAVDQHLHLPALEFDTQSAGRSLLETIATSTVAVAGIAFSVTLVAFTLASSQLSPSVLRSFRGDRMSQLTLAVFLGTFTYCLVLLVRLGASAQTAEPPNLSVTLAVVFALLGFMMFAAFIAHIVRMLQPTSVIASIHGDADAEINRLYPAGPGKPGDPADAQRSARETMTRPPDQEVRAESNGYLVTVEAGPLIAAADEAHALIRQDLTIGEYVLPGTLLASIWLEADTGKTDELDELVRSRFRLGSQRTGVQDVAFPVRQLADIALKGLSPGINDPTTAISAIDAAASIVIAHARAEHPSPVRVGPDGSPRFVATAPSFDDLVKLTFGQSRIAAAESPVVLQRFLNLLDQIEREADSIGLVAREIETQRNQILAGLGDSAPTDHDIAEVRREVAPSG